MIKHEGDKWILYTKDGSKKLGTHSSEKDAQAQEAAIEASKHSRVAEDGSELTEDDERHLHLLGATGTSRTERMSDKEYLVVPVTALMEGVIHAVNAPHAEFVPFETLSRAPQGWNGRPVMLGHPVQGGKQVSANDPRTLEERQIGTVFESKCGSDKRLLMEAWIDEEKALKVCDSQGVDGKDFLDKLRTGKSVEVSVGAYVSTDKTSGHHNGKTYKATWRSLVQDHLAFLPKGRGACSIEMGCGTHRAAEESVDVYLVTAEGLELEDLGGQGSGNFNHSGRPGEKGGSGGGGSAKADKHDTASSAHLAAAKSHLAAAAQHKSAIGSDHTRTVQLFEKTHADDATKAAIKDTKSTGTRPYAAEAANAYNRMAQKVSSHAEGVRYHTEAAKYHQSAAKWHQGAKEVLGRLLEEAKLKAAAAGDTLSEAASEEAAELIGYDTMKSLLEQAQGAFSEMMSKVDELISAEVENPTQTPEQEAAEEEIETARLEAIQVLCSALYGNLSAVMSMASNLLMPDASPASVPRYMMQALDGLVEELTTCIGARHSTSDNTIIQNLHDQSVLLGATCTPKVLEEAREEVAAAIPLAAAAAEEEEALRAACRCKGDNGMTPEKKAEVIKNLTENRHSGFTALDVKALDSFSDERLEAFTVAATSREAEFKAAQENKDNPKPMTDEEFMKNAPPRLKSLLSRQERQETERKAEIVTALKACQDEYTESELSSMSLEALERMAKVAKIYEVPDYTGRAVPRSAAAMEKDVYANPPDPYEAALKTLRERTH